MFILNNLAQNCNCQSAHIPKHFFMIESYTSWFSGSRGKNFRAGFQPSPTSRSWLIIAGKSGMTRIPIKVGNVYKEVGLILTLLSNFRTISDQSPCLKRAWTPAQQGQPQKWPGSCWGTATPSWGTTHRFPPHLPSRWSGSCPRDNSWQLATTWPAVDAEARTNHKLLRFGRLLHTSGRQEAQSWDPNSTLRGLGATKLQLRGVPAIFLLDFTRLFHFIPHLQRSFFSYSAAVQSTAQMSSG